MAVKISKKTGSGNTVVAAMDIGSNSFRLLVAETDGCQIRRLHHERITVRLAAGMQPSAMLQDDAMHRGLQALTVFARIMATYQPARTCIFATAALRNAKNSHWFLDKAEAIISCPITVISGEEEGALSLAGVLSGLPPASPLPDMVIDVGGGSTELIFMNRNSPRDEKRTDNPDHQAISFPVGAVTITDLLNRAGNEAAGLDSLRTHLREIFAPAFTGVATAVRHEETAAFQSSVPLVVATGGTATAMAALDLNLQRFDNTLVHNHRLAAEGCTAILERLAHLSPSARNSMAGLGNGRGDIIIAGVVIYQTIIAIAQVPSITVSATGLLEGMVLHAHR